jgi:hypothetical protein
VQAIYLLFSDARRPVLDYGLDFEIIEKQTKQNEYLFKSSHLLLDSVDKSPLYYKTKKKKNSFFLHESRKKNLRYIYPI